MKKGIGKLVGVFGPGGAGCSCCKGGHGKGKRGRIVARKVLRAARRKADRKALKEGLAGLA